VADDSDPGSPVDVPPAEAVDDTPTIACTRCDSEWDLSYELDELHTGNQAVEQFALDHKRHTGHYPDGVATWRAACRQCVESTEHLSADAARRWAKIHARHTRHSVDLRHATDDESSRIEPDE
jgi:hypothetical protein